MPTEAPAIGIDSPNSANGTPIAKERSWVKVLILPFGSFASNVVWLYDYMSFADKGRALASVAAVMLGANFGNVVAGQMLFQALIMVFRRCGQTSVS